MTDNDDVTTEFSQSIVKVSVKQKDHTTEFPLHLGAFKTPQGEYFMRIRVESQPGVFHFENWPVDSSRLKMWVENSLTHLLGGFPSEAIVKDVLRQMRGNAQVYGETFPVFLRIAQHGGRIYIDLCNETWQVVEISTSGWQVLDNCPVMFRRSPGMQALPTPIEGGTLHELLKFINIGNKDQEVLLLSWLVGAFHPTGPYPILTIKGSQGSAKSTCQRILRMLVDPSDAPLRTAPRDERDLVISAKHAHLVAFDNLSNISPWLSDSLCRLATGGGLATRQLYTDETQKIFQACRPILLNGIGDLAERGDLLDRVLALSLPTIPKHLRKAERELWEEFDEALPRIFGALCSVLSSALAEMPNVKVAELPRMADFAIWATAAEPALGFTPGTFMEVYNRNRLENSLQALEASSVVTEIIGLLKRQGAWEGSCGDLLKQLNLIVTDGRRDKDWPRTALGLRRALDRAEPNLKSAHITFEVLARQGGTGARAIRLQYQVALENTYAPMTQDSSMTAVGAL